jgi:signal transduction histidine kinase
MKVSGGRLWTRNVGFPLSDLFPLTKPVKPPRLPRPYKDFNAVRAKQTAISLIAGISQVREKERQQIASELHDCLGQSLVLTKMKVSMLEDAALPQQTDLIRDIRDLLDQSLRQVRSLISGLHSDNLRDLDLCPAIESLLQYMKQHYDLRCLAHLTSPPVRINPENQELLLLAIRELLINVAKHACINEASVTVRGGGAQIIAIVADQGKGFDPKRKPFSSLTVGGFGLTGVRKRIALLGGSFKIHSHPGKGTKAVITLPLDK